MTPEPEPGLHLPATDASGNRRIQLLRELGLTTSNVHLDACASRLAGAAGAPYAMVNFITADLQFFAGLHTPRSPHHAAGDAEGPIEVGRTMSREHGYCPEVLERGKALVLPDVCAWPRFSSNRVVDEIGIRTYAGAPLIDERTGTVLGTVCFVGTEPRPKETGRDTLHLIKDHRDQVMQLIYQRTGTAPQ